MARRQSWRAPCPPIPQTARDERGRLVSRARLYLVRGDGVGGGRRDENGIDFVIIATPNDLHCPVAKAFLAAGIHVICDKPLAFTVAEGEELVRLVEVGTALFALTHNYTGYPAVRQAREMVRSRPVGRNLAR